MIALIIFVAVEGALVYALIKFRKRKGAVPAQIRGNTRLEVGWTVGAAALILVGLAVVTFVKLSAIENPPNSRPGRRERRRNHRRRPRRERHAQAAAERQIAATSPSSAGSTSGSTSTPAPTNPTASARPTRTRKWSCRPKRRSSLDIVSDDVVHSWWIPELGGKFQAVPGYHNYTWFKIEKPGVFRGQCAFLCGRGHARMIATVRAVPPAQFEEWLTRQKQLIQEANEAAHRRARKAGQAGRPPRSKPRASE